MSWGGYASASSAPGDIRFGARFIYSVRLELSHEVAKSKGRFDYVRFANDAQRERQDSSRLGFT